ncbi:hypothetical protein IE53DRAFT_62042 [Violaceomyces palustris]|uniref:Uncharacterized protein n=1 Tax=Violaceomyces palustris TaxID=1673888 RepID=A0ACD0NZA5_9BASI|nr:hypothetical protein IE53DRAFT_62042 [Violaceomyces palustris]
MTTSALMAAAETLASVASASSPNGRGSSSTANSGPKANASERALPEPKKRTRPVSACEACRAKKIRCLLNADAPVCQNCLASGKECLFRVDDLVPSLRAARFAHYGPPSANARVIPEKRGKGSNPSSRDDESSATEAAGGSRPRQKKRKSAGGGGPSGGPARRSSVDATGRVGKAKAVFKSFANPTNLAAPLPVGNLPRHPDQGQGTRVAAPHSNGQANHDPFPRDGDGDSRGGGNHSTGFAPSDYGYEPHDRQRGSGHRAHHQPPPQPPPSFSDGTHSVYSQQQPSHQRQHSSRDDHYPSSSSMTGSGSQGLLQRTPGSASTLVEDRLTFSPVRPSPTLPHRRSYSAATHSQGSVHDSSIPFPVGSSQRSSLPNALAPSSSPLPPPLLPPPPPAAEPPDVDAMSAEYYGHPASLSKPSSSAPRFGNLGGPPPPSETNTRFDKLPCQVGEVKPEKPTGPPPGFPRPKILLPFFRWFGTTANTPGYRKIKVGVYQESDLTGEDLSPGDIEGAHPRAPPSRRNSPSWRSRIDLEGGGGEAENREDAAAPHSPPLPRGDRTPSSFTRELFEINRPRYPRSDILIHLVGLFLTHFKPSFCPWFDAAELKSGAENGSLPAILANAICAISARFSNHSELRRVSRRSSGDTFSEMAKILIIPLLSFPSIEVIEVLTLLSYAEFASGSDSGLWMYVGMALRMAEDLGLQHEASIMSMPNGKQRERARILFWAIVGIDRITTFGTGRPVTIRESNIDTELPRLEEPSQNGDELTLFVYTTRILLQRGRMGELLNQRGQDDGYSRKRALVQMWIELAQMHQALPSSLHFNVQTFQKAAAQNLSPAFVYLHVLFQSTIGLLDRPSLMKKLGSEPVPLLPSFAPAASSAASRTISDILTLGDAFDDRCITASPYLDQLVLPAGRSFLAEREAAKEMLRKLGVGGNTPSCSRPPSRGATTHHVQTKTSSLSATRSYADINLGACQRILNKLQKYWGGANWPAKALEQEAAGVQDDVDPEVTDEDAQSAPIRDVEMVLKWAKGKIKSQKLLSRGGPPSTVQQGRWEGTTRTRSEESGNGGGGGGGGGIQQQAYREDGRRTNEDNNEGGPPSTKSADSPFGLGISADFSIDVEALLGSWEAEQDFNFGGQGGMNHFQEDPPPHPTRGDLDENRQNLPPYPPPPPASVPPPPNQPYPPPPHGNGGRNCGGEGLANPNASHHPLPLLQEANPLLDPPTYGNAVAEFFSQDHSVWPLEFQNEIVVQGPVGGGEEGREDNLQFLANALQLPFFFEG